MGSDLSRRADRLPALKHSGNLSMAVQRNVVAVVDDDLDVRNGTAFLLSAFGYCTELFDSGKAFLEAGATSEASCLVVDIQLGDISGIDLGRQLAANNCKTPIIFMTALEAESVYRQAMEVGVACLRKPFPADLLVETLVKAIGHVHASDE